MEFNYLELIATFLTFSGWITFFYSFNSNTPKIKGTIIAIATSKKTGFTSYIIYPYLINYSTQAVEIIDFSLEINFGRGFISMRRDVIQLDISNVDIKDEDDREIQIKDFEKKILTNMPTVVEYGKPIHGFLCFLGPPENYEKRELCFNLICTDSSMKKHLIYSNDSEIKTYLFQDLANVKFYRDYNNPFVKH